MTFRPQPQTFLRASRDSVLSIEQMQRIAPALFAPDAHSETSSRYVHIPTAEVIQRMDRAGFSPVYVAQSRAREDRRGHARHMIRFASRSVTEAQRAVGDIVRAEVIVVNAHDGSAAYRIMGGLLVLVCLNGAVAPGDVWGDYRVRHAGNAERIIKDVVAASNLVIDGAERALTVPKVWKQIDLSRDERMALAESAHTLRFADKDGTVSTPITAEQLLVPRRPSQISTDLWNVWNTIQEHVIVGGDTGVRRDGGRRMRVTSRRVTSINEDVRLNRALWQLGEKMAALKGA